MNSTYKIALAAAAALCLVILGYFLTQGGDTESPIADHRTPADPSNGTTTPVSTAALPASGSLRPPPRTDAATDSGTSVTQSNPPPPSGGSSSLRALLDATSTPATTGEASTPASEGPPSRPTLSGPAPIFPRTGAATPDDRLTAVPATTTPTGPTGTLPNAPAGVSDIAPPTTNAMSVTPASPRAAATTSPPATPRTYTVKPGDTFSSISTQLYGSERYWVEIAQANPTVDPTKLKVDQVLRLPDAQVLDRTSPDAVPSAPTTPAGPGATATPGSPGNVVRYTVRPGDSLSTIAQQYYGDPNQWRAIFNANLDTLGSNPDAIQAGETLVIPPAPRGAQ